MDYFSLLAPPQTPITGLIDNVSPLLDYVGNWTTSTVLYAHGESVHTTSQNGDAVEFEIYSDGFALLFLYQMGGGTVDVCIDETCTPIATDGMGGTGKADFVDLAIGLKQITVTHTSGGAFSFDGVYVYPLVSDAIPSEDTAIFETFTYDGADYNAQLDLSFSAGEVAIFMALVLLACFQVGQFAIKVWRERFNR